MKVFKIKKNVEIVCEWKKTRNGFKHEATLIVDGADRDQTKICYLNRTWERYEFDSVLEKLLNKTELVSKEAKQKLLEGWAIDNSKELDARFGTIAAVAKLGEIFCAEEDEVRGNKKASNDWKARMIKAGLGEGLIMPSDWGSLSEDEKASRLDKVIKELATT